MYYVVVSIFSGNAAILFVISGYIEIQSDWAKQVVLGILTVAADEKTYNNLWVKTSSFILGRPSVRNME